MKFFTIKKKVIVPHSLLEHLVEYSIRPLGILPLVPSIVEIKYKIGRKFLMKIEYD